MGKKEKSITYKDTGVDIHSGNEFVKKTFVHCILNI